MNITSIQQLREIYDMPNERAVQKELTSLETHSLHFIAKSPFFVLATYSAKGEADASPRGGAPGFVRVIDQSTIAIPDARGNNRLDSLTNIVETGKVGLLFFIPGIDETLRVNGTAVLSTAEAHLSLFHNEKNFPKSVIIVSINQFFMHCAKAFMRSNLWHQDAQLPRDDFPTMGEILKDHLHLTGPTETHEAMVKRYKPDL